MKSVSEKESRENVCNACILHVLIEFKFVVNICIRRICFRNKIRK